MQKETNEFIFFFRADSPFSNFYDMSDNPIVYNNIKFSTSEHAFMYLKAKCFGDTEIMEALANSFGTDPLYAKRLGRKVKNFDAKRWNDVNYDVMYAVLKAKFSQPELKQILLNTGDKQLVEASPYDAVWGIKMSMNDPDAENPQKWRGENRLGNVLSGLYNDIKKESGVN